MDTDLNIYTLIYIYLYACQDIIWEKIQNIFVWIFLNDEVIFFSSNISINNMDYHMLKNNLKNPMLVTTTFPSKCS